MEDPSLVDALMQLGFPYDVCVAAVAAGNQTVEQAVDWCSFLSLFFSFLSSSHPLQKHKQNRIVGGGAEPQQLMATNIQSAASPRLVLRPQVNPGTLGMDIVCHQKKKFFFFQAMRKPLLLLLQLLFSRILQEGRLRRA